MSSNDESKNIGSLEDACKGSPVSRRWLLRTSANAAAGVIAVSALKRSANSAQAEPLKSVGAAIQGEGIPSGGSAGYIHSLHGWDTI